MIRRALILALAVAGVAEATPPRTYIQRTNNVNALHPDRFEWSQTDEVQFDVWPRAYGVPLELDGWFPMIFIADPITETMYIAKTGSIVEAGRVRFGLDRAESNLSSSNSYLLTARLYNVLNTTQHVTIARGGLKVLWSPDAQAYAPVGGIAPTTLVFNVTVNMGESGPVSWSNLLHIPAGFADGIDNVASTITWAAITEIPTGFADGIDDTGASTNYVHEVLGSAVANIGRTTIGSTGGTVQVTGDAVSGYNLESAAGPTTAGGITSINGATGAAHSIVGVYPVVVTNVGATTYVSWGIDGSVIIIPPALNTAQVIQAAGSVTQTFVVGVGVTQLYATITGAAGGGASGSYGGAGGGTWAYGPVTGGETLDLIAGLGGVISASGTNNAPGGWPYGGDGVHTNFGVGSGGGLVGLKRGTNWLVIAGSGGGAAQGGPNGGSGGGATGASGTGSSGTPGQGASQSTPGITNGAFLVGGAGVISASGSARAAGGGGAGFYGGGGALANSGGLLSGGGGAGYINTAAGWVGITTRGAATTPPFQDDPLYVSGKGVSAINTSGGDGLIILRWEAP